MMKDEYEDYVTGKYSTHPTLRAVNKGGRMKKVRKSIQPRKRVTFTLSKKCNNGKSRKHGKHGKHGKTIKNKKNKSRRKYTF